MKFSIKVEVKIDRERESGSEQERHSDTSGTHVELGFQPETIELKDRRAK